MKKVSIDVATADINRWLDHKNIPDETRESQKAGIQDMINAVQSGYLIVSENNELTYTLIDAVQDKDGAPFVSELKFKNRLRVENVYPMLKNVSPSDVDGRIYGYVSALTGVAVGLIKKMYTDDLKVPQAIALFFM